GNFVSLQYSFDGNPLQDLFAIGVNTSNFQFNNEAKDNDPFRGTNSNGPAFTVDGVVMSNRFDDYSADIDGTGSTLEIVFTASLSDRFGGTADAFAFRNLAVNGIPTPSSSGLLVLAGVATCRRRR
ncbi:MAG: hypothetical protein AAGB34_04040, partial [Planctomycetota bacterium]